MPHSDTKTTLDLPLLAQVLREQARSKEGPDSPVLLCYGTGEASESLCDLQQNLLQQLSSAVLDGLPANAKALLIGDNLQEVAAAITEREREVTLLGRTLYSLLEVPGPVCFQDGDLLSFEAQAGLDLIVFEGSMSYLDQLSVLQKARALLNPGGRLFLLGEYLAQDTEFVYSALANLESLHNLSVRLGFSCRATTDFSAGAILSLRALRSQLTESRAGVLAEEEAPDISGLSAAASCIEEEFLSGRRCLQLIELESGINEEDEWAKAEFAAIDSFATQDIALLFEKSFQLEFDREIWDWKYRLGQGRCVIARTEAGGDIVAHYGGAPRQISYFGEPAVAIQVCDVMVLPEVRRSYGKSSLFFRTAATFLEREIGYSVKHLLGFGFPNQKAMNIAIRLGLYEKTDEFVEVHIAPDTALLEGWRITELQFKERAAAIDTLWQQMRDDFSDSILGERNSAYFDYRFRQHPFGKRGQYRALQLVDAQEQLSAVAVLKPHGEHMLLMDVFARRSEIADHIVRLQTWSHDAAKEDATMRPIKFWVTRSGLARINLTPTAVHDLGIEIPCNSWNAGPPAELLRDKWWLTAGDMDFL